MIQDMTTKNGTFVNKEAIDKSLLFHGDSIIIGAYTLQFLDQEVDELQSQDIDVVSVVIEAPIMRAKTACCGSSPSGTRMHWAAG